MSAQIQIKKQTRKAEQSAGQEALSGVAVDEKLLDNVDELIADINKEMLEASGPTKLSVLLRRAAARGVKQITGQWFGECENEACALGAIALELEREQLGIS